MDRIFQHYQGTIDAMQGARFSCVKVLEDAMDHDVILLWMRDDTSKTWYRVFIDGAYCGVDQYGEDESEEDIDDDVIFTDYSAWFHGKVLESARVLFLNRPGEYLLLLLDFGQSECKLLCRSEAGECVLQLSGRPK